MSIVQFFFQILHYRFAVRGKVKSATEIRGFRRRHKDVVFQVKEAGSREIEDDVLREELELGIITLPVRSKEALATPLLRDPIVPVAARRHPLAGKRRIPSSQLDGLPVIGFEAGSAIRRIIDRALEQRGVSVRVVMELRSIQSILRMVSLNLGLAFVSRLGVEAAGKQVRVLDVSGLRINRTLAVIRKSGRPLSVAAEAFLEHLESKR